MPRATGPTAEGLALLMPYYKNFESAYRQGYRSYEMWSIMQQAFEEGGADFRGATIFDVNHLWSRATAAVNAEIAFGRADPTQMITGEQWAWAPWASPTTASELMPNYMLNYTYSVRDAEGNVMLDANGDPVMVGGVTDWPADLNVTGQDIIDRTLGSAQSSLDTGSPGAKAQLGDLTGLAVNQIESVQILRF